VAEEGGGVVADGGAGGLVQRAGQPAVGGGADGLDQHVAHAAAGTGHRDAMLRARGCR
jgi:hypothetical protein